MFFEKMLNNTLVGYKNIVLHHRFNQGLKNGTLPFHQFYPFIEQDKFFLLHHSNALKIIAERMPKIHHQHFFDSESQAILQTQMNLHDKYLQPHLRLRLFFSKPILPIVKKSPIVEDYVEFIVSKAKHAPICEAVAAIVPCLYFYHLLGLDMKTSTCVSNPYQRWIDSYSSPRFVASAHAVVKVLDELALDCNSEEEIRIETTMVKSIQFEIAFWDAIVQMGDEIHEEVLLLAI